MTEAWRLARDLIVAPSKAVERLRGRGALRAASMLFVAFCAVSVAFYALKPPDFPPPDPDSLELPLGLEAQGWLFWTKVQLWQPLLAAILVLFLGWFCAFFRSSLFQSVMARLDAIDLETLPPILSTFLVTFVVRFIPFLLLVATVLTLGLVPFLPDWLYVHGRISRGVLLASWLGLLAAMLPGLRRVERPLWRSLAALILSIDVVNVVLLLPFIAAVAARSARGYFALELVMVLWSLSLGSYVVSRLAGLRTPRAFAALFLSTLCQAGFVFALRLLGLVSSDILKGLMSV